MAAPGEMDESSLWYTFADPQVKALDQAIKARRASETAAHFAQSGASAELQLRARITDLEDKLLALGLYSRTILQLLHDKGLVDIEEFSAKMRELDLLDGKLDNR